MYEEIKQIKGDERRRKMSPCMCVDEANKSGREVLILW